MTRSRFRLMAVLALCATGCAHGALGQSELLEAKGEGAQRLSTPIAVGAELAPEIAIDTKGSASPAIELWSVRPGVLETRGRTLVGRAPGVATVLIREPGGVVVDLLHVWVAPITHLSVHRTTSDGADQGELESAMDLLVGDIVSLEPRAYSGPQRLAGRGAAKWTVEPPDRLDVLRDGVAQRRRIRARTPGQAVLTIETLGEVARLQINVVGGAS